MAKETKYICAHPEMPAEANRRYANSRSKPWFQPIIKKLRKHAGYGRRCMYCSGSEASDIEHYKPKTLFPELALAYENFLWICAPCNRHKGDRFPPVTGQGAALLNPLDDNVWEFFFIDQFGLLTPLFRPSENRQDQRAVSTRDIVALNREAIMESRLSRLKDLKKKALRTLDLFRSGKLSHAHVVAEIEEWKEQPFQPDVADFFLNGPGKSEAPFRKLFEAIAA